MKDSDVNCNNLTEFTLPNYLRLTEQKNSLEGGNSFHNNLMKKNTKWQFLLRSTLIPAQNVSNAAIKKRPFSKSNFNKEISNNKRKVVRKIDQRLSTWFKKATHRWKKKKILVLKKKRVTYKWIGSLFPLILLLNLQKKKNSTFSF